MTDTATVAETAVPAVMLDARRNAFRPDLAAAYLEGKVEADRFTQGTLGQIVHPSVPLRKAPDATRGLETEVLFGEAVTVFDEHEGWAWVQLARDGYVGYIPSIAIRPGALVVPTHRVQALGTFIYPEPNIKTPPIMHLPLNALVTVTGGDERFASLQHGGFVIGRHLATLDRPARDFVEIAERFIGTPYLWGGCTRIGIDCSGLVQAALLSANIVAPRDSDMQRDEIGHLVALTSEFEGLERGDLVFWPGHVGIMSDSVMMVHANAHHMMVAAEPLPEAARRIEKSGGGPITAVKRLGMLGAPTA
ncbi:MAG: NlpC/P60 family protein [Hyphomicrobium sp.]